MRVLFLSLLLTVTIPSFAAADDCSCQKQFAVYQGDPVFMADDPNEVGYTVVTAAEIAVEGGDCLISQETVFGEPADEYYDETTKDGSKLKIAKIKYVDQDDNYVWVTLDEMNEIAIKACFGQLS